MKHAKPSLDVQLRNERAMHEEASKTLQRSLDTVLERNRQLTKALREALPGSWTDDDLEKYVAGVNT